jgi:2-polyprenyl-6-methoxyphenol hydroxylase-like FAD-dependent oxidoreductase
MDIAALGRKVGASSICLHRAALQRFLLDAARVVHPASVEIGRECVGVEADKAGIFAFFADGSQERGDLLIGADGVHSVIRRQLFGDENLRFAGYVAWRGVADTAIKPPLDRAADRAGARLAGRMLLLRALAGLLVLDQQLPPRAHSRVSRQPRRCERAHKGLACPVPVFRRGYFGGGDPA